MARIVFATLGSLGDLHPVLAFALGLRVRGHDVAVATSGIYREKIDALGLEFHPLRPELLASGEHVIAEIMDGARGTERLMRDHMLPAVRDMHADLAPLAAQADALVASELIFAAPILAATTSIRWISYCLAPISLFSRHDPPVLPVPPALRWIQHCGPKTQRLVKRLGLIVSHSWWRPVRTFRAKLGLPAGANPLFDGKHSPLLNLALFSAVLQPPQADWPPNTIQTGFLFHDENNGAGPGSALPPPVETFLDAGEPPIVFTLGSAAVYLAGRFYEESARAAQQLGRRAILLLGKNPPPPNLPSSILAWDYLPYGQIFPRAAAIVHQGGVGTTAQALRAGRPMLVVPFAHDQFDNAARIVRLDAGCTMPRRRYRAKEVARALGALLRSSQITAASAAQLGARIHAERGVDAACDAVEPILASQ